MYACDFMMVVSSQSSVPTCMLCYETYISLQPSLIHELVVPPLVTWWDVPGFLKVCVYTLRLLIAIPMALGISNTLIKLYLLYHLFSVLLI